MVSKTNKIRNAKMKIRKFKKKANPFKIDKVPYIDYKDVTLLQKFMSDRSKIRGRHMSGTNVQEQRDIATAIKNAREMALLPYTKRVSSVRAPRSGGERGRDGDRRGAEESLLQLDDATIVSKMVFENDVESSIETAPDVAVETVDADVATVKARS